MRLAISGTGMYIISPNRMSRLTTMKQAMFHTLPLLMSDSSAYNTVLFQVEYSPHPSHSLLYLAVDHEYNIIYWIDHLFVCHHIHKPTLEECRPKPLKPKVRANGLASLDIMVLVPTKLPRYHLPIPPRVR